MHQGSVRRAVALAAIVLLVAGCGRAAQASASGTGSLGLTMIAPADREVIEPLSGQTLTGGTESTADHLGKVVVVNAWASWCAPCRDEIPLLVSAYESADRDQVAFIGLDVNDEADQARAFAGEVQMPYPSVFDADGSILATVPDLPAAGLPTTVFVDRQGRLAARIIGPVKPGQVESVVGDLQAES